MPDLKGEGQGPRLPRRNAFRLTLLPILLLIGLPLLLFWQVWWPDPARQQVFAYGDFVEQHYLMRLFVSGELREGRLPLWDPYTYGGEPAGAASLFAPFYPLALWQVAFPPGGLPFLALELEAILHLGLAGTFTFLLVRRLTGNTGAGILAGIAFSLGGFLTSYPILQLVILEAAIWLPAGLWLLERGLSQTSWRSLTLAGLAFGSSLLAGHPQTVLYIIYLSGAYLLFRSWRLRLPWRFTVTAAGLVILVAVGFSAVYWLPTWEMGHLSPRADLSYTQVSHGFSPGELWGLLRPNPGQWSPLYVGLVPLILASLAVILRRDGPVWFWAGTTIIALLLSLGSNGPLYPLAYRLAPGFSAFRDQERAAFVVSFSLAVLAGYGYGAVARSPRWPRSALLLLLTITFLDLFHANNGVILQKPPAKGYLAPTEATRYLQGIADPTWRTSSEGLLPGGGNAGLAFRIRDITGNGPLHLAAYDRFLEIVPELRWWQMLNVHHVLTRRRLSHGALRLILEEDGKHLYQAYLGQQPAWITHDFLLAADQEMAIQATAEAGLNPLETAVLEVQPEPAPAPAIGTEFARVVHFAPQQVVLEVELSAPGILVLSEIAYPGWNVRANGRPMRPLRAYGILRAVALPAGHWLVEWRFQSLSMRLGLIGSALTLSGVLAAFFFPRLLYRRGH